MTKGRDLTTAKTGAGRRKQQPQPNEMVLFRVRMDTGPCRVIGALFLPAGPLRDEKWVFEGNGSKAAKMIDAHLGSQNTYYSYREQVHFADKHWLTNLLCGCGEEFDGVGAFQVRDREHFNTLADALMDTMHETGHIEDRYGLTVSQPALAV